MRPGDRLRILTRRAAAWIVVLAALSGGCGYRLQTVHGGRFGDPALRVDLQPFRNLAFDPDAGALVAARVREELRRTGFRGEFDHERPDFRVEGVVRQLVEGVTTHGADGYALEHRLTISVDLRALDAVKGRVLVKEDGITESAAYFSGADLQYTESNRRMALEEVVRRIARRIGHTLRMVL